MGMGIKYYSRVCMEVGNKGYVRLEDGTGLSEDG
jgi:hypothetical protein